jgi:hypothetical protein
LLIVLTEGELRWDRATGDFDWAGRPPLPARLRGVFPEEPRYVDLRWNAQAALATSRALAAEATAAVQDGRLDAGLLLAAQSYESKASPEARSALAAALMSSGHLQYVVHEDPVELVAASADGRRLAIVRRAGPLVVWDLTARRVLGAPVPLPGRPVAIALSPRGRMLAISVARLTRFPSSSGAANIQIPVVVVWDVDHRRFVLPVSERQAPSIGASVPVVAVADSGTVAWSGGRRGLGRGGRLERSPERRRGPEPSVRRDDER